MFYIGIIDNIKTNVRGIFVDSLSFGKMQNVDNQQVSQVSFTGQKSVKEASGAQRYGFFAPPYDAVAKDENGAEHRYSVALEVVPVKEGKDKKGFSAGKLVTNGKPVLIENSNLVLKYGTFYLNGDDANLPDTDMVGYRFVLIDEDILDKTKDINQAKTDKYLLDVGSVAEGSDGKFSYFSKRQGFVNKIGPMLHVFPDAVHTDDEKLDEEGFVRNPFNKAGGNIQGMIKELYKPDGEYAPYEMVISTPLFGADNISSHGYWTMNPFQIASTKGTLTDFKQLQNAMFDNGKTYIADGAFTSLSFESPQVQSVFKWGKKSPFYNWVKFDKTDAPNTDINVGVFPDAIDSKTKDKNSEDYKKSQTIKENIGFKVINPKYIEADAKSRLTMSEEELRELKKSKNAEVGSHVIKNPDYDKTRPTYIQLIDKRLASKEQCEDIKEFTFKYDNPTTENHYDISEHQDSVQPFYFEVDPDDNRFKTMGTTLDLLNEVGYVDKENHNLKRKGYNSFFQIGNYSLSTKGAVTDATTWDGNVDLLKANLSNPSNDPENILGNKQVKNYYYNIASYWTKTTDNSLVEHIAKNIASDKDKTFQNISENHSLSIGLLNNIYDKVINSAEFNANFKDKITGKSTEEVLVNSVVNFPLESIEFAPDLTAVLASDFITPRPLGKNEDERQNKAELLEKMPSNVQNLYKNTMQGFLVSILKQMDAKMPPENKIFKMGSISDLTDYGKVIADIVAPDIMKYGVSRALFPDLEDKPVFDDAGNPTYSSNLSHKGVISLGIVKPAGPKEEADAVIGKLRKGFDNLKTLDNDDLVDSLVIRFSNVSFDDIKAARAIVDKTGAGLNWRFDAAKDVADLDARRVQNPHTKFEDCWDGVIDFWGGFIESLRKENPASYVIAEVTDLWSFSRWQAANKNQAVEAAVKRFEKMDRQKQEATLIQFFSEQVPTVYNNPNNENSRRVLEQLSSDAKDVIWHGAPNGLSGAVFNELKEYYIGIDVVVGKNDDGSDIKINSREVLLDTMSNVDFGKYVNPDIAEKMFYEKTGATTGSNYSTFFGLYPELFGQNYENGRVDFWSNDKGETGGRLYNMKEFENGLKGFFQSNSAQFINKNHIFVNNHDKPRPFHCVSVDMELFLSDLKTPNAQERARKVTGSNDFDNMSSMGIAVGEKYLEIFDKAVKEINNDASIKFNVNNDELDIIKEAIGNLAAGKFMGAPANMNTSRAFGYSPFDITMKDVMQEARYIAAEKGIEWPLAGGRKYKNKRLTKAEKTFVNKAFKQLSPELGKLGSMFKMMMFAVGVPTLFAGDEMAHSGYEMATKNVLLAIRNLVHHSWLDDEEKGFIKDFYKEVTAAAKAHKKKPLSAVADGFPLIVPQGDDNHTALFKYNDKGSKVLVVYSNARMETGEGNPVERARKPLRKNATDKIDGVNIGYIDPQQGDKVVGNIADSKDKFKKLEYDAKRGKYIESKETYSIDPMTGKLRMEINNRSKGPNTISYGDVELDDVANVFYKVS